MPAPIPAHLQQTIETCLSQVAAEPTAKLNLASRQRIWSALGPRARSNSKAVISTGHRRRTFLALRCAQTVLPLWRAAYADEEQMVQAVGIPSLFFEERVSWLEVRQRANGLFSILESSWVTPTPAFYAGRAVAYLLGVTADDEQFIEGDFDRTGLLDYDDPTEGDCAWHAARAFSGEPTTSAAEQIPLRHQFWTWYLSEAVPDAWLAVPDEPRRGM